MEKSEVIKSKQDIVKRILTDFPETRDDDRKLIASYWRYEQPVYTQFGSAEMLLLKLTGKELSEPETITRARRLVQARCPELRGKAKDKCMEIAEEVRNNINE